MAQTTDGYSFAECQFEYSFNNSDWDDASGWFASVAQSGGERQTGEIYTSDGDTAIITKGKRTPEDYTIRLVHTEGSTDPHPELRDAFEAGSQIYVRWSPKGGATGDLRWTSGAGYITSCPPPVGEAGSGEPVAIEIGVKVPKVTDAVIA